MSDIPPADVTESTWLPIATLLRPQGRRGELLSEPLTDLQAIFTKDRAVRLVASTHGPGVGDSDRILESCWRPTGRNAGLLVLKLSGCDSIHDAEALVGCQIRIPAQDAPALDEDTYFVGDLVGCAFFAGGRQAGAIVAVEFPVGPDGRRLGDAAPLLAVEARPGKEPALVPFIRAWLDGVDLPARRVTMRLPDGLLDPGEDDPAEPADAL